MDTLRRQVRRAQRRLAYQRFLGTLPWSCFAAFLIAAALIVVEKYFPMGVGPAAWLSGAAIAGLLFAGFWAWLRSPSDLEAAVEIDRRFGLRERVSSTLALDETERETPAGQALVRDAIRGMEKIEVGEAFGLSLSRWAAMPLAPAIAAILLAVFFQPVIGENEVEATTQLAAQKEAVKKSSEALRKKLAERQEEARKKGLKDAEQLFTKLEQGTRQVTKNVEDRKQAMVKLNDLAKELEKRQQEIGGAEKLKEQFQHLKDLNQGPADKVADALKNGDFQQAADQLKNLRDQIDKGMLDEASKAKLEKQLGEMQDKLNKLADAHKKAQEDLKKQIAEKRAAGKEQEAEQLEQKLAKLQKQAQQMKKMEQMAQKLGQCGQCMKKGDKQGAAQALDNLATDLDEMAQQAEESEMLNDALDQLADAKDAMNCKQCNGQGCKACQGNGNGEGNLAGMGLGRGRGQGDRPEEEGKTGTYDTKVAQKYTKGPATVTDQADGPNIKGRVQEEIRTEFEAVRGSATDPLTGQQLPREYKEHARKYFDSLREGKK